MAFPKKKYWIEAGDIKTKLPKQHDTGMFRSLDEIVWDILKCCGWDCCNQAPGDVAELTFENGLTRTVNTVKLGGALTGNTTVSGDNKDLTISIVKNANTMLTEYKYGSLRTTMSNGTQTSILDQTPGLIVLRSTLGADSKFGVNELTPTSALHVVGLPEYADNAAALVGLLTVGAFYHTAGVLKVVI